MLDRVIDVLARDGVVNVATQAVAAAQVFFVGFCTGSLLPFEPILFIRGQLKSQSLANLLRDCVLNVDDVGGVGVDTIAPKQVAGVHVNQLRRDADAIAGAQEAGGQDRRDTHLASGLSGVDLNVLILNDLRRRAHDQGAHAGKFGDHGVGERKLVKAGLRIVADISERKNGNALALTIAETGCRRVVHWSS